MQLYDKLNDKLPCHLRVPSPDEVHELYERHAPGSGEGLNKQQFLRVAADVFASTENWWDSVLVRIAVTAGLQLALFPLVGAHPWQLPCVQVKCGVVVGYNDGCIVCAITVHSTLPPVRAATCAACTCMLHACIRCPTQLSSRVPGSVPASVVGRVQCMHHVWHLHATHALLHSAGRGLGWAAKETELPVIRRVSPVLWAGVVEKLYKLVRVSAPELP